MKYFLITFCWKGSDAKRMIITECRSIEQWLWDRADEGKDSVIIIWSEEVCKATWIRLKKIYE
jgi:hypothetical protein